MSDFVDAVSAIAVVVLLAGVLVVAGGLLGRDTERDAWCAEALAAAPTAADSLRLYAHPDHPCKVKAK